MSSQTTLCHSGNIHLLYTVRCEKNGEKAIQVYVAVSFFSCWVFFIHNTALNKFIPPPGFMTTSYPFIRCHYTALSHSSSESSVSSDSLPQWKSTMQAIINSGYRLWNTHTHTHAHTHLWQLSAGLMLLPIPVSDSLVHIRYWYHHIPDIIYLRHSIKYNHPKQKKPDVLIHFLFSFEVFAVLCQIVWKTNMIITLWFFESISWLRVN